MSDWKKLLQTPTFRVVDKNTLAIENSAMSSFAIDDALAISVSESLSPPLARFWVHDNTIVLGIQDTKLPYIADAINWLHKQGYQTVVRNSGGLAVALDEGVLNLSFVLPDAKHIGIHEGYEAMVGFIQYLFRDLTNEIKAFEVTGSYCPGEYDLSIEGKKFAGISQRRVKDGFAVQIYLCIEGKGEKRAALIRDFYQIGRKQEQTPFQYPEIVPETMASLSQLLQVNLSVNETSHRIRTTIEELGATIVTDDLNTQEKQWFEQRYQLMLDRNKKAFGKA